MNFLICSDSFKESLASKEIGDILTQAINDVCPNANVSSITMADGGEGSLDAIENIYDSKRVYVDTYDANSRSIRAYYLVTEDEIFIEMANSVGIALIEKEERNILE